MTPLVVIRRALFPLRAILLTALAVTGTAGGAADPAQPTIRESSPEIYYMQDDAGRLVPVPGFRYRDFVDLLRIREGLPGLPEAPAAVLERVAVRVRMPDAAPADLEVTAGADSTCGVSVELSVRQSRAGWVSVPLGLDGLLITGAPTHEGPGTMLIASAAGDASLASTAPQATGYRLWLSAPVTGANPDMRHVVRLEGSLAVDAAPTHDSIVLDLPRATASLVEITTPREKADVVVRPATLPPRVDVGPDGIGSIVSLVGLAGPSRIRLGDGLSEAGMTDATVDSVVAAAVPQSSVESIVRIDGRVAVTEASLRIDSLAAGNDTIRLALPTRATLRGIRRPTTLVRMEGSEAQPVAVVRVDRAADGRCEVDLETERPIDPTGRDAFEPLGFAVEGIPLWRQSGRASIVVEGDWQVEWDDAGGNRRIDPPPAARRAGFVAAFAFDAQPARLPLRVRPRGSRVVIEPEYRYDVAATRVSLDARLRVSVRGAPTSRIVVLLEEWDIDEVGPSSIVDVAAISTEDGRVVIPFVQPLSGDAVVEIRGGTSLAARDERVAWRIPAPQADLVGPASIVIVSQSDIELLPDAERIQGLVRHVAPSTLRADADRATLAYRLDGTEGSFAATRRFLPRRVDAAVSVQADIDASETIVSQTVRFDVAHVPMEFAEFDVPQAIAASGSLEFRQNGQLLSPVEQGAGTAPAADSVVGEEPAVGATEPSSPVVRMRAMLATPLLGAGEMTVQYSLPTPTVPPETTVADDLPLVLPVSARIGRQTIVITAPDTLAVDVRGAVWKREGTGPGASAVASRTWTTSRSQAGVPLALSARRRASTGETEVEAAWFQTFFGAGRRQDIYAFAISSSAEQISLALPSSAVPDPHTMADGSSGVEVKLDGRRQPDALRADGRIVVELPQRSAGRSSLLEIACTRPREIVSGVLGPVARMPSVVELEPPSFLQGTTQRRFYWELLLEPDDHAIRRSGRWTSQQRWEWGDVGMRQVPVVSRGTLATWLAATVGDAALESPWLRGDPPGVGPRIVYSGVGPPGRARIWVVPTWLLVLVVSGVVLAVGLLAVYRTWMRSIPAVLSITAVASLAAAMLPDLAPLVAQAAVPGVVLTALAAVLSGWLRPPGMRPARSVSSVSASSLTRAARPSLIIAAPADRNAADATAAGGQVLP